MNHKFDYTIFKRPGYRRTRLEKYVDDNQIDVETLATDESFVLSLNKALADNAYLSRWSREAFKYDPEGTFSGETCSLTREAIRFAFFHFEELHNWYRGVSDETMDEAEDYADCNLFDRAWECYMSDLDDSVDLDDDDEYFAHRERFTDSFDKRGDGLEIFERTADFIYCYLWTAVENKKRLNK